VHDYHLMMLPKALREAGLQNKVGFFLHTPFAPPQHWRAVMHHKELLESLCEADLLGVHTQREVHAVWECTKALKKRKRPGLVQAFPIGIDYAAHHAQVAKPEVQRLTRSIRDKYPGKQIIFSVSRLDYTKGILTQLTTVEQFLHAVSNPECYIYKLVVAPSREGVKAYSELQDAIAQKATAINAQFARPGWRPIQYAYEYHSPEQLAAWYGVADVLLLTPVIDGMNLVAKEYVAVRSEPGVLVLSAGAGVAAQLQTALRVPPEDADAAAIVLAKACNMKDDERQARWHAMQENVRIEDVFWWAGSFIRTLRKQ
jgi:trehalose-6-phosphate synthase